MSEVRRVAYLFGTGATQAEMDLQNPAIRILMNDIRDGIYKTITTDGKQKKIFKNVINELVAEGSNVEHIITLYESSGTKAHARLAKQLKKLFRDEIQKKIGQLGADRAPILYAALIDMHKIRELNEVIAGVLTLNYESLLEQGIMVANGCVDYAMRLINQNSKLKIPDITNLNDKCSFPVLKMHGSFNWENAYPVVLKDDDKIKDSEDILWIPPGAEKKHDRYPFNVLWGKAMEVLECDILRVIGCSLDRNDWHLISLLHRTQKMRTDEGQYMIELIGNYDRCMKIREDYRYLSFRLISEIPEVRESVKKSLGIKETDRESKGIEEYLKGEQRNYFDIWLRSKGENLIARNIPIQTEKRLFERYMNQERG